MKTATAPMTGLLLLVVAAVTAAEGRCSEAPEPPLRPNVLLVSIDTLRADRVSAYGHQRPTTPTLDALASRGVLFENAYSHSPKTAISHMSIMTGLYPEAHGVRQFNRRRAERLQEGVPTLASLLSEAGYRTAALTGGGNVSPEIGFDIGMDSYRVVRPIPRAVEAAVEEIDRLRTGGSPFFLFLHAYDTHDPYLPSEPFRSLYTDPEYDGDVIADAVELERLAGSDYFPRHRLYWKRVDKDDPRDVRHLLDLYDAQIRFVDQWLGELVKQLEVRGLFEDTLVVMLSDHGEQFGEHGEFLHNHLYQEILRVPLILVPPARDTTIRRGWREPGLARLVDLLPTLLDYLGLPAPEHLQGRSLLPLLGARGEAPEPVLSSWPQKEKFAIRVGRWKLICERRGGETTRELYDLVADPGEQRDIFRSHLAQAARLERELDRLVEDSRAIRARHEQGKSVTPDAATLQRLQELGYAQ